MSESLIKGQAYLAWNGYHLFATARVNSLPGEFIEFINQNIPDAKKFRSLICVASPGRGMWEAMRDVELDSENPIDVFTAGIIDEFISKHLGDSDTVKLFPSKDFRFGVQRLGEWLGWVHPSPIGIGISQKYGLWKAYRSVLLTTLELSETPREYHPSPCDSCETKPCIGVCPAAAVKESVHRMDSFDVKSCAEFRLEENSNCEVQCLSRLACPVGREYRYTREQLNHHYGKSLPKMAAYLERHNTDQ